MGMDCDLNLIIIMYRFKDKYMMSVSEALTHNHTQNKNKETMLLTCLIIETDSPVRILRCRSEEGCCFIKQRILS